MSSSNNQFIDPSSEVFDNDTGQVITPVAAPDQIAVLAKAEIDQQIATAKMYPRSEDKSLKKAESLACRDEETAGSMFYSVPRGGKHIEGASVRLAEVLASTWGNLRIQARTVDANDKFVTVQAVAHDLESNTAILVEKRRRVIPKKGRAVDDDSIQLAGLAGQSIVFRDAVFKVVGRVYVDQLKRKAQLTSIGKAETIVKKRDLMLAYFSKMGVGQDRVLSAVGASGMEDIDMDCLITLKGMATAIKDGQVSVDEAFPDPAKQKEGTAGAVDALKAKQQQNGRPTEKPAEQASPEAKAPTALPNASVSPNSGADSTENKDVKDAGTTEKPAATESHGEVPEWVLAWEKRIDMMPKFSPAASTFDELLKEYRGADEDKKGQYFDLFGSWLNKTLPFADKPSLVPLLNQKLDQLAPYVPESVLNGLKAKVAEGKK